MSNAFTYQSIKSNTESLFKDKGSKHFGYAYPVSSRNEINEHIGFLRKTNSKANHVCFAWILRENNEIREYNTDDGEPNNSAGPPILGQLKSSALQNVLVAVVRYFGGTKLGVSGLINAYKTTAKLALDEAILVKKEDTTKLKLNYEYAVYNQIIQIVKELNLNVIFEENKTNCTLKITVPLSKKMELNSQLEKMNCNLVEWGN